MTQENTLKAKFIEYLYHACPPAYNLTTTRSERKERRREIKDLNSP